MFWSPKTLPIISRVVQSCSSNFERISIEMWHLSESRLKRQSSLAISVFGGMPISLLDFCTCCGQKYILGKAKSRGQAENNQRTYIHICIIHEHRLKCSEGMGVGEWEPGEWGQWEWGGRGIPVILSTMKINFKNMTESTIKDR